MTTKRIQNFLSQLDPWDRAQLLRLLADDMKSEGRELKDPSLIMVANEIDKANTFYQKTCLN